MAARAVAVGVALLDRLSLDSPDGVRQQLDVAIAREPADPVQLADVLHAAGAVARDEVPLILFLVAVHPAPRVEPPDLLFLSAVAQLTERDLELRGPGVRLEADLAVPHGVPAHVPAFVGEHQVNLGAGRGQVEFEPRSLVEVTVEADAGDVAGEVVTPRRVAVDERGIVVRPDGDVHVAIVVQDLELRLDRRGGALDGQLLDVVAAPRAFVPRGVVEPSVDLRRGSLEAHGVEDPRRARPPGRIGGLGAIGRRRIGRGRPGDGRR